MESLPAEVLEKIISHVQDRDSLCAFRLVSHRWCHVTTPFLRRQLTTAKDMNQFLKLYRKEPQFRYGSLYFDELSSSVTSTVQRLLRTCAASIRDVEVFVPYDATISPTNFQKFLGALDTEVIPNLKVLSINGALEDLCAPPPISLRNLVTLRLLFNYSQKGFGKFAAALLDAAPNLKVLEVVLILVESPEEPFWPFPERCRAIPTILLRLNVDCYVNFGERVSGIAGKLEEWPNVRLIEVILGHGVERAVMPEVKGLMERVLGHQAKGLRRLTLVDWTDGDLGPGRIVLPDLVALETLQIDNFGVNFLQRPIRGDRLRALHRVSLHNVEREYLTDSVLDTVKVFRLHQPNYAGAAHPFTPWATVFPNLETLVVDNSVDIGKVPEALRAQYAGAPTHTDCWLDMSLVAFLLGEMRMPSLKSVAYGFSDVVDQAAVWPLFPEPSRLIGATFSGIENLEEVVEGAKEAQDEEVYWAQAEALRRPCITNLEGLRNFSIYYPIDDAFAIGVLLRMKPLDVLDICFQNLSEAVLEKVTTHHKSLRKASDYNADYGAEEFN